jgi:hypothetical protein
VVLVAFGAVVPISGDFRSLVVLSFLALLYVSCGWGLISRLARMLLSLGLALPAQFFCSGLLRLRGLALLILCRRRTALMTCGFSARCLLARGHSNSCR